MSYVTFDDALTALEREPGRDWTPCELSIVLGTPPDFARRCLRKLVDKGSAVVDTATGRYRLSDVQGAILQLLQSNPCRQWTPHGIATELTHLHLTEKMAAEQLLALLLSGSVELWVGLPGQGSGTWTVDGEVPA